jgi:hypothetical protein
MPERAGRDEARLFRSPARIAERVYAPYEAPRLEALARYFADERVPRVVRKCVWLGLRRRLSASTENLLRERIAAIRQGERCSQ